MEIGFLNDTEDALVNYQGVVPILMLLTSFVLFVVAWNLRDKMPMIIVTQQLRYVIACAGSVVALAILGYEFTFGGLQMVLEGLRLWGSGYTGVFLDQFVLGAHVYGLASPLITLIVSWRIYSRPSTLAKLTRRGYLTTGHVRDNKHRPYQRSTTGWLTQVH